MAWPKGKPRGNKSGGRKKGTPNVDTRDIKEIVEATLGETLPQSILKDLIHVTNPREAAKLKLDLMGFIYPRRKATEMSGTVETTVKNDQIGELVKWLTALDEKEKS